jgi:hypothetical protein
VSRGRTQAHGCPSGANPVSPPSASNWALPTLLVTAAEAKGLCIPAAMKDVRASLNDSRTAGRRVASDTEETFNVRLHARAVSDLGQPLTY